MKALIFMLVTTCISVTSYSQTFNLSFVKKSDTVKKSPNSDLIYKLKIKAKDISSVDGYLVDVEVDNKRSSLPATDFSLDFKPILLSGISGEYSFYITINRDTITDRKRSIFLKFSVTDKNGKSIGEDKNSSDDKIMELVVKSSELTTKKVETPLKGYDYLGYVGTNFDLVDGVRPKNLFFATNIFLAPNEGERYGFNVMIYGNRAFSNTVTNGRKKYASKIVGKGNNTAMTYYDEGLETIERTTDNLGAMFSPLIYLGNKDTQSEKSFHVYYSPQIEFIWRRTVMVTSFSEIVRVDSVLMENRPITGTIILTPESQNIPYNVYDFNVGFAGVTLKHQSPSISVRVNMSFGLNFSYSSASRGSVTRLLTQEFSRQQKWFLGSRLWITEPSSGLTFGAEIYNNVFGNYQPYYNVTLSKAIDFANLGKIFSPISSR